MIVLSKGNYLIETKIIYLYECKVIRNNFLLKNNTKNLTDEKKFALILKFFRHFYLFIYFFGARHFYHFHLNEKPFSFKNFYLKKIKINHYYLKLKFLLFSKLNRTPALINQNHQN